MRILRLLIHWWESQEFKRRWRAIHRNALPIDAGQGIFLSICAKEHGAATAECFARVWQRIPKDARDELRAHWKRLQLSWDSQPTGIPLHIPVIAVGNQLEMLRAVGSMIGIAIRTRARSGSLDSADAVMRLFSGAALHLWADCTDPQSESEQHQIANAIAHYYLCMREKKNAADYSLPFTTDFSRLAEEWR